MRGMDRRKSQAGMWSQLESSLSLVPWRAPEEGLYLAADHSEARRLAVCVPTLACHWFPGSVWETSPSEVVCIQLRAVLQRKGQLRASEPPIQ